MAFIIFLSVLILQAQLASQFYIQGGFNQTLKIPESGSIKIGFGSCYDESQKDSRSDLNLFKDVLKENLDVWVWLGDMAYVDNKSDKREKKSIFDKLRHLSIIQKIPQIILGFILKIEQTIPIISHERRQYWLNETFHNEFYSLLRSSIPVVGIWDDHDYGVNDGDYRNPFRTDQKQLFLDYIEEPAYSERRNRGDDKGIYQFYQIHKNGVKVLLILMDVRYEKRIPNTISESQWQWLENVLEKHGEENDLILIGSGTQFMLNNRIVNAEHWDQEEIIRLVTLISKHVKNTHKVIFLSGDVHHAQFTGSKCALQSFNKAPFFEVTSSGITHTCDRNLLGFCDYALKGNTPSKFQISDIIVEKNYGIIEISSAQEVKILIKGRNNRTLLEDTRQLKQIRAYAYEYCDKTVFLRIGLIQKVLVHIIKSFVDDRNFFLIGGIGGVFFWVSFFASLGVQFVGTFIVKKK